MEEIVPPPEEEARISFPKRLFLFVKCYRKSFLVVLVPVILWPIAMGEHRASLVLYLIALMSIFWVTEALPLAITSLLPIILFPVMGVMTLGECSAAFISDISITLLGTYIFGQAMIYCLVDQRIALNVLHRVSCQPRVLHVFVTLFTFLVSAWVINMYVVALMCPIVRAILRELETHGLCKEFEDGYDAKNPRPSRTAMAFYMGVTFAAVFGGCSTYIGSGPNTVMMEMYTDLLQVDIPFFQFMGFAVPVMLLLLFLSTVYLQWLFLGLFQHHGTERTDCVVTRETLRNTERSVSEELERLAPMVYHEKLIVCLFTLMGVLFLTRTPGFYPGWNVLFNNRVKEASVSMLIVILIMCFPSHSAFLNYFKADAEYLPLRRSRGAISWNYVRYKVPWRILFMIGGGLTLAEGSRMTQMSSHIANFILSFQKIPNTLILFSLLFPVFLFTQVFGNVPLAYIILPIVMHLSDCHNIHPTYLVIPTALMCNLAMTTGVGASSNTLVVGFANIRPGDVFLTGALPALVSFLVVWLSMPTYGALFFPEGLGPYWRQNQTLCNLDPIIPKV